MSTDKNKVAVAITGAVQVGLTTAAAPTSQASALVGFTDLGGIHPDGVTRKHPAAGDVKVLKFWQNGEQVRVIRQTSDDPMQVTFTLMETNKVAIETAFGVTVTQTATEGSYVIDGGALMPQKSLVFDIIDGAELERQYYKLARVSAVGDITYNGEDSINIELTLDVERDTTIGGHVKIWSTRLKT